MGLVWESVPQEQLISFWCCQVPQLSVTVTGAPGSQCTRKKGLEGPPWSVGLLLWASGEAVPLAEDA